VQVKTVGLCGSDLHYFAEGGIGDTPCSYPMILGHEPAGIVAKIGRDAGGWRPGDRAALEPAVYCYHCEYCLTGRHNVCANLRFLSMPGDPGFLRDYVNLPATNILPMPPNVGLHEATLFEPLAVVLHSLKFVALQPGETVATFGAGPIGLLTIAVLRLAGAGRIWAVEPVAHRRELSRAMGADVAIDPRAADPVRQILSDTGQRGVDVAIDCVGTKSSLDLCLRTTRAGGRVVLTGLPTGGGTRG
jgi:L-iditol 2-dehydrogenase